MGDSDDDYNHGNNGSNAGIGGGGGGGSGSSYNNMNKNKNRDKFHRERDDSSSSSFNQNNNNNNNYNKNNDRRNEWNDRGNRGGRGMNNMGGYNSGGYGRMGNQSSDYSRKYTNQSSPGNYESSPPPHKRNKKDWDSSPSMGPMDSMYGGNYQNQGGYGNQNKMMGSNQMDYSKSQNDPEFPTQPPFLSFKSFLQQQSDDISDEEAIKRYNEYKIDFKKTQINNFFLEHKEEEWFKSKYNPDENYKRRNEQNQFILDRLEIFMDLMNNGWLNDISVEYDKSKQLTKFLDAVVIKLENGTDQDLKQLDGPTSVASGEEDKESKSSVKKDKEKAKNGEEENNENSNDGEDTANGEPKSNESKSNDDSSASKRKAEDSGSESGAYSDSDDDDNEQSKKKKSKTSSNQTNSNQQPKQLHRTSSIFMRNLAPSVTKQDLENLCRNYDGYKRVALSDPAPERGFYRRGWITFESNVDVKKICWSMQNIKIKDSNPGAIVNRELTNRVRPIANLVSHHKSVVKNDIKVAMKIIQNMDKKWNLWQEDPQLLNPPIEVKPEVSKEENKEKDQQQSQADNESANLEEAAFSKLAPNGPAFLTHKFNGINPLLNNITDYLVDEISAEEEELLGDSISGNDEAKVTSPNKKSSTFDIDIDKNYNKVLDRMLLYLRVVHSIDFYNGLEYQQEDLMPNRCGIMFVRPALPSNAASASLKINNDEISSYIQQFESKIKPFTEYKDKIDVEMAKKLGIKDRKEEIEKFIKTNTQELAPDRWLCPLSGKRFKGPEFIRKHLFYKHMEKINEVKKEVEYFNNYIFDPKRPQLPEHPSNKSSSSSATFSSMGSSMGIPPQSQQSGFPSQMSVNPNMMSNSGMMGNPMMGGQFGGISQNRPMSNWQPGYMPDMMQQGFNQFNPGFNQFHQGFKKPGFGPMSGYGGGPGGGGGHGRRGDREIIQYKDLDAPEDR